MGACKKVFSFVSCVAVRGKGNINVPIKAFNAPETWPGLLTTFEGDNANERMRKKVKVKNYSVARIFETFSHGCMTQECMM